MAKKSSVKPNNKTEQHPQSPLPHLLAILALLILTLIMFADVIFTAKPKVLSSDSTDLATQFLYWRQFGFEQLKQGNLPMWNPHLFSGTPFFGAFQAALLYPLNAVYLFLPLANAVNVNIVLHVFLTGLFMYLWAWRRGLHPLSCWLTAVLLMLCGTHFMRIFAGHLTILCVMPWIPLIFLTIEAIYNKPTLGWLAVGIAAVAMLILAGHPQYVFYTAIASLFYCLLLLFKHQHRLRIILLLACMAIGGVLLASAQLLTGLEEATHTVRGTGGVPYDYAAMFSFPPENLITLLAPNFLGSLSDESYWGRCYLWEMSLFFSVTGLVLAVYGSICAAKTKRRFCITMITILFVLALGGYTPLFRLLYKFAPGFDKFRGTAKFTFLMIVFVVMLAGAGLHQLITSNNKPSWRWIIALAIAAGIVTAAALAISTSTSDTKAPRWWQSTMRAVYDTGELYRPLKDYQDPMFVRAAAERASRGLLLSAGSLVLVAALFVLLWYWRYAAYALVLLAFAELIFFAYPIRRTFDLELTRPTELKQIIDTQPAGYRILMLPAKNKAMALGALDIWGYDPAVLRRYSEFITSTQGADLNEATEYVKFRHTHRLFAMLRLQHTITEQTHRWQVLTAPEPPLPRLMLVNSFKVLQNRDAILSAMASPTFDFRRTVILESPPNPLPAPSAKAGTVKIIDESTDHITIEADLETPAILLVTDAYHPNWHADPLPGSSQQEYQLMPANYVLRAIPLTAGHHRFRLQYQSPAFTPGMWISIVSLAVYLTLCTRLIYKKTRKNNSADSHFTKTTSICSSSK